MPVPLLDGCADILHALDLATERVYRIYILGEHLVEKVKVFGVQGEAIAGDGILNGEVV